MKRFCYKCGALEAEKGPLIQGLCQKCFAAEYRLLRVPKGVSTSVCKRCGAYTSGNRWQKPSGEDASYEAAQAAVRRDLRLAKSTHAGIQFVRPEESDVELSFEASPAAKDVIVDVRARGKIHELQKEPSVDSARVLVKLRQTTCDVCGLIRAGYYEAILQVRSEEKLSKSRIAEIKKMLQKRVSDVGARDDRVFVTKIEEKSEGVDFYVSSLSLARAMAALLKERFHAKISEASKLIGQERGGKKVFRVSVLARLPTILKESR